MPYSKKPKSKNSRAIVRKAYPKKRNFVPLLSPMSKMVHLRYQVIADVTSTGGTPTVHRYRANGMFDPDITGAGSQPRGFDQWMGLYDHYTVVYSKINVRFASQVSNANTCFVGVRAYDSVTAPTSTQDFTEARVSRWKYLTSDNKASMTLGLNMKKYLNGNHSIVGMSEFRGSNGADPTEQAEWQLFCYDINGGTTGVLAIGTIDYWAVLTEPVTPAQS